MIEFLPPRDGAFGDRDAADFVGLDGDDDAAWGDDEPPRSRWLTGLATLGVTGLLAGGVLAAAPWDTPDTAPPETTAAPPTTVARPPSLRDLETEPTLPRGTPTTPAGWIPVDGSPYQVVYAFSAGEDFMMDPSWGTPVAVYASDGDVGRTTGRWLAVESRPAMMSNPALRRGGVVADAGGRRALVSAAPDGVVTVEVEVFGDTGQAPVRVTGFGVALDTLLSVAATVELVWEGNVRRLGLDAVTARAALDGLTPRVTDVVMQVGFDSDAGEPLAVADVAERSGRRWARAALLRQDPRQRLVGDLLLRRPFDVSALPIEDQRRLDDLARRGLSVELARSVDAGHLVGRVRLTSDTVLVVTVDGSAAEVIDLLESVRPATDDEWVDLLVRGANDLLDVPEPVDGATSTDLGSGREWWSSVTQDRFSIGTSESGVSEPFTHGQGPELVEYRSLDHAYLRATTTFPNEARSVIVAQNGADPQRAKLVEISGTGVLAAVVQLDPTLPYTVAWVDKDEAPVDGPVDAAASASAAITATGEAALP